MKLSWRHGLIAGIALTLLSGFITLRSIGRDSLTYIERECRDDLLQNSRMTGVTEFSIEKNYNWWERSYTLSGLLLGAKSEPYLVPRVEFIVRFKRQDQLAHRAWVQCQFRAVPDSGNPPRLLLDHARVEWELVLDPDRGRWDPWSPK